MKLRLITAPASEPIVNTDVESYQRITNTAERTELDRFIKSSREYAENIVLHRALLTQTWELYLDQWPENDYIELPKPPLQSVTYIKYKDTQGTEYTLDAANYVVDTIPEPARVVLAYGRTWPTTILYPATAIRIRFVCGYTQASDIPKSIINGLLYHTGLLYERRDTEVTANELKTLENIYAPYALPRRW